MSAGSLISIMPKYVSVRQSVRRANLPTQQQPVRRQSTSSFHLQSARPTSTYTRTHRPLWVHTIFKLGKAPTPIPSTPISNPITPAHGLTRKQLLLRFWGLHMWRSVWWNFLIYFLANGSRPFTFSGRRFKFAKQIVNGNSRVSNY